MQFRRRVYILLLLYIISNTLRDFTIQIKMKCLKYTVIKLQTIARTPVVSKACTVIKLFFCLKRAIVAHDY